LVLASNLGQKNRQTEVGYILHKLQVLYFDTQKQASWG
jgi:hypothetical protein